MRLCRFLHAGRTAVGFYHDDLVTPLSSGLLSAYRDATHEQLDLPADAEAPGNELLEYLPPDGPRFAAAGKLAAWLANTNADKLAAPRISLADTQLLTPIPRPNKLFLLAGNYAAHIREGGGVAAERAETFPYVFLKPPSTTLTDPGRPVKIPSVSPQHIDWECELAVVIGRRGKHIPEAKALEYVAGYTVINDISDRKFRPNPGRKPREKDSFFDWLHGKWHDSFCPCGPCITSADAIPDPQALPLQLALNGAIKQDATTAQQIFPVAAVIEFISQIATLEPGDIISTGTPAGVGNATGEYVRPGDRLEARIGSIGTLVSPVEAES